MEATTAVSESGLAPAPLLGRRAGAHSVHSARRFRLDAAGVYVLLSTMMLPHVLTVIPTYVLFARVGLVNTYWPWALWGLATSPYLVFLFRQFFSAIPSELEDAAIIDGCGYGRIFFQIFLPLS